MAASSGLADTMITWKKATNGINLDFMVTLVPFLAMSTTCPLCRVPVPDKRPY